MVTRPLTYTDGVLVLPRLLALARDTFGDVVIHSRADGLWCAHANAEDHKGCTGFTVHGAIYCLLRQKGLLSQEVINHHVYRNGRP